MSDRRRLGWSSGRLTTSPIKDFWQISRTVQDPSIPNLPLETPEGGAGTDALTASNLDAGTPTVGAPLLGQIHVLAATGLAAGTPTVGSPLLGQVHILVAAVLDAGTPDFGAPLLSEVQLPAPAPETPAAFVPDVSVMQVHGLKRKKRRERAFLLLG